MKVSTLQSDFDKVEASMVIVGALENCKEDPLVGKDTSALGKLVKDIISLEDFKGESGELLLTYTQGLIPAKRVLLVGLGKEDKLTIDSIRKAIGNASRKARDSGAKKIAISVDHFLRKGFDLAKISEALVQGFLMGSFQNLKYKTKNLDKFKQVDELILFSPKADQKAMKIGLQSGEIIAKAVNFCRELAWGPANDITPTKLAEEALRLEKEYKIKTTIFDREKSREIGLHSFLAVAQGTEEPPKFIIMEYGSELKDVDTLALIGKAITFDSGGISIKPSENMGSMKTDMTGGAVVLATMEAIAQLKPNVRVIGLVPATDNMPSGKAYHPGDIVNSYSGQTIEVISTDAEGRMIINDALTYAARNFKPKAMFDFATLTGSMWVALGNHTLGYFSNDDQLAKTLEAASEISGEPIWRMPLWEIYDQQLKSDIADFKHTGGRPGGAITAARFLSKFVEEVPWIHMDIAGYASQEGDDGYNPSGNKGPAVRLMVDLIRNWKK